MSRPLRIIVHLAAATAMVALMTLVKELVPALDPTRSFVLYFFAIAASAWFGGRFVGLFATALVAAITFFLGSRSGIDSDLIVRVSAFTAEGIAAALLIDLLRRQRDSLLRASHAVDQSRDLLNSVIENVPIPIVATNPDGTFWLFNRAAEQMTGYDRLEVMGRGLVETFVPAEWQPTVIERFSDPYAESVRQPHRNPWRTKTGEERLVEWRCAPLPSLDGIRILGIGVDVTDVQRMEDERAQLIESERSARAVAEGANAAKDLFLTTISHELRAPLTSVLGWAQVLRGVGLDDRALLAQGLAAIEENARAQATLIEDLIDYTRIASGRLKLEKRRVRVADVVRSTVESFIPEAQRKEIEIRTSIADQGAFVIGDERRLRQVFMNVMQNAVRYTDRGHIDVSFAQNDGHVTVSIADTGRGISREFLPRIFDRFTQEHGERPTITGLGIGLAVVRDLVALHGGRVEAESDGAGKGARFAISLPVASEDASERV